ncbi:MAG TPA: hypothetical protein VF268_14100 [Gammaproteobacteria bacterium]
MFASLNLPNTPNQEPCPLDFAALPPNHNPLIQEQPTDTLDNIHAALRLLIRLLSEAERMELNYTERETRGLLCVMECLADAVKFELYHRGEEDKKG